MTEGRGSNAGTCIINLKPWADRERTSKQIIEELEKRGTAIANVKLEFFEPPAVPGFGAAGGFSVNLLDKTNSGDYKALGEETDKFMEALGKRPELKGLFTFFAANYPQYEIVIDNDVAMQKGVSIRDAMDNLSTDSSCIGSSIASFETVPLEEFRDDWMSQRSANLFRDLTITDNGCTRRLRTFCQILSDLEGKEVEVHAQMEFPCLSV